MKGRLHTAVGLALLTSCGGSGEEGGAEPDAGRARLPAPLRMPLACGEAIVDTPPLLEAKHVPEGTEVAYSSNPPSSGAHYAQWAAYATHATPVDRRAYVHNLEHGGIVLAYRCEGSCPDVVAALERVVAALPDDAQCQDGVRVRALITPDPFLDVPVAAAAWGWTYRAPCLDEATLIDFTRTHYGQGTEFTCADGRPSLPR